MKLIERYPVWSPSDIMQEAEDRIFSLLPKMGGNLSRRVREWTPATDVQDAGDRFVLRSDLPGLKAEDIEVSVEDGTLTIKGERKFKHEDHGDNFRRFERVAGSFERSFSLPENADPEKISASCKDGVLEVVIHKHESEIVPPRRRIAVES